MRALIGMIFIFMAADICVEMDLPVEKPIKKVEKKAGPVVQVPPSPPTPPTPKEIEKITELPPTIYGKDIKPETPAVIYIVDISSSMELDIGVYTDADGKVSKGNRLDRAKSALIRSIRSLPKNFEFELVAFDCQQYFCFSSPYVGNRMSNDKDAAIKWVNELRPIGGTGTGPAVEKVLYYFEKCKYIILLTDGSPNCGAGSEFFEDPSCIKAHESRIREANKTRKATIDVYGINAKGMMRAFCTTVAGQNNGNYVDVE
jgi:hypothetical protein